ncbi:MAG TPA: phosphoglycolate phosphatase [Burkholderiales bacterium]|nr:phosphoglycolate phosphatase [Burkholderiales bacterium]
MVAEKSGDRIWRRPSIDFPLQVAAVAFDLDGTMVETLPDLHESANRMLNGLGRAPVPEGVVRAYIGDGVDRLVKRLLTGSQEGEPDASEFERAAGDFRTHYAKILTRASHPFPGAIETLETLRDRGFRLACVTNKPARFTEPLLAGLEMTGYLDLVLSGDSLPKKKPDALPLVHAANAFGIDCARLLMVGDSAVDAGAARAAGCPVFCVPYGYRGTLAVQELDCDAIVPALSDLPGLIRIPHS